MTFEVDENIINKSIEYHGKLTQEVVCMEECSELIQAISKEIRGKSEIDHLTEEMADVLICINLLMQMYGISESELNIWIVKKQERIVERMKERENNPHKGEEKKRYIKPGKKYKHFKGKMYLVLNIAEHTETGDKMIDNKLETDNVNHPPHYQGARECIEVMRDMFGDNAVMDFCRCNAYKYRFRAGRKEGNTAEQDIKKAEWYERYLMKMNK